MNSVDPSRLCMLATVYEPYRWCADHTHRLLNRFWPSHPPLFFCGLTASEAGDLPHVPFAGDSSGPRVWAEFALDAARQLQARGFELVYFLLEDHPPVAPCHELHLNKTLPELMNKLPASYIGLLGWDNRRFATPGGPILPEQHRFMHLTRPQAPRFHLHPSLFRMSTLVDCLSNLAKSEKPNPWGFEKLSDKPDAKLSGRDKAACYQICGEELSLHPPGAPGKWMSSLNRFLYHRAMAPVPWLRRMGADMAYWDLLGFDDFFYPGPFPLFYSGIMSRKQVNPFFVKFLERQSDPVLRELLEDCRTRMA